MSVSLFVCFHILGFLACFVKNSNRMTIHRIVFLDTGTIRGRNPFTIEDCKMSSKKTREEEKTSGTFVN